MSTKQPNISLEMKGKAAEAFLKVRARTQTCSAAISGSITVVCDGNSCIIDCGAPAAWNQGVADKVISNVYHIEQIMGSRLQQLLAEAAASPQNDFCSS
jgi:hypothetical protein